ncbi:hypothetical protein [Nitrospina gracilis]|uniref:hypothetical protein n=1 Tax=Nitrospina gracilis TaxID=35801 RepID=UPI001F3101F5|nr:hypothetical protein [Nitrospina gracilis]MCF8719218.1 hypothetical protein [Nitrospina gracilis Nb-211]
MTAATADRNTQRRKNEIHSDPVKASTKIFMGTMVCLDASGLAVPGADTAGLRVRGMAREQVDNSAGANSAKNIETEEGVFLFTSSGLTDADVGKAAYIADDQTVQVAATTNKIVAGMIVAVESATKAWVWIGAPARMAAVVAAVSQANAAADISASYVEAEVQAIADLANANKTAINNILTSLKNAGVMGS